MVTPLWLETLPTVTVTGTALPPGADAGIRALICRTPASPGASPIKSIAALTPPIVTETPWTGCGNGAVAGSPSTPLGEVCPSPVTNKVMSEFGAAGCKASFTEPSPLTAAAGPFPAEPTVKMPGAESATPTEKGEEVWPLYETCT